MKKVDYDKLYNKELEDKYNNLLIKLMGIEKINKTDEELFDELLVTSFLGCTLNDSSIINIICDLISTIEKTQYKVVPLWGVLPFITNDTLENDVALINIIVKESYYKAYIDTIKQEFYDIDELNESSKSPQKFIKYNERIWEKFEKSNSEYLVFSYTRGKKEIIKGLMYDDIWNRCVESGTSRIVCTNEYFTYVKEFLNDVFAYQLSSAEYATEDDINWLKDKYLGYGRKR